MSKKRSLCLSALVLLVMMSSKGQVALQTGSAVFSLPMFNWQDDKSRLNSLVALSYNSGNGLKVNDLPSNVGQDWSMVAGGSITRMQVGEPDDQLPYAANVPEKDNDITKIPPGILFSGIPAANGCPSALTKYPIYGGQNVLYAQHNTMAADRQLDYFAFQFNGKTGMFILDTVGGFHGVPLGDSKLKITFQFDYTMGSTQGIRTSITSFTIQDVDGLIYKFTKHGLTKVLRTNFCTGNGLKQLSQPKIENAKTYYQNGFDVGPTASPWINSQMAYPYTIGSWYLTEIDDPLVPSRNITFVYSLPVHLDNVAGADVSYNSSLNNYMVVSYKRSITETPVLDSIIYPDKHHVVFNYAATTRVDYQGDKALAYVDITYDGRHLSQYQLNTTYFISRSYGTPVSANDKSNARLCLKSVKKIGVDLKEDTPPYIFDYYMGSNAGDDMVPPLYSYSKDIWGFYNGNNNLLSNSLLTGTVNRVPMNFHYYDLTFAEMKGICFQNDNVTAPYLNAKPNYAQNGLLKQITYPTGGSLTYTYAQNTGTFMTSATVNTLGGVHVSKTSSSDGGFSNGCGTPVVTNYDYVVNGPGSASSIWGVEAPFTTITSNNTYAEELQTWHWSLSCIFTCCKWHFVYPGILSQTEAVSLEGWQAIMVKLAPVLSVISTITDILDIVNVSLDATPLNIVAVVLDVIASVVDILLTCEYNTKYTPNSISYNFDLNSGAPMPAQFKQVEITESPGTTGKTVQKFTHGDANGDTPDYPLWIPGANSAMASKQRFAPWAYGLPKLTTVYDKDGNKIKETQNVYDFTYAKETISDPVGPCPSHLYNPQYSCKCLVQGNYSQRNTYWGDVTIYNNPASYITTGNSDLLVDIYNFYSGRVQLTNTYDRIYRVSDATQFVQTETDYYYNIPVCNVGNYDVNRVVTTQSNGDVNTKNIHYSVDYNTGVLATMVANNMSSVPVATINSVVKSGGGTKYLSEKATEFIQLANGDIKPSRIIEQRFATPPTSFTGYSGPTTTNYTLYKIPQAFTYDANSNLIGLKDEGSRNVANIYDYSDKYIVASVINADPVVDKPAYTSFETAGLGGWTLTGTAAYSTSAFISGSRGFILSSQTLSATLNTAKPYILSFWANSGGITVTGGATLVKSAPTYLGMTYYEYNIALGTTSVSVTGSAIIDELRLYPANSRMRTTTYDPLIGKTSECDENNRIVYYEYDNLGRLRFTKDENKNIVKMNEYNNVSSAKQVGCPATFSNLIMNATVTRNNCGAGYQGTDTIYTVPAATYTSNISQQDADIQAFLNVLKNGQAFANANAGCKLIYYNTVHSETDSTKSCADGYEGGWVTYTVPANTYSSIISQADADQQALDDIAANAIANANNPPNAVCTLTTVPDWEWTAGDSSYCLSVGGNLPAHLFEKFTDFNPNSSTFNQTQWEDVGPSTACPAGTYYNSLQSGVYTRNNCGAGFTGGTVTYYVAPGKYSSVTSQAAANTLATNDVTSNGQAYANTAGLCIPTTITLNYSNTHTNTFTVQMTNTTTFTVYTFTANASTPSGVLGTVPNGTYDFSICPNPHSGTYNYSIYHTYYSTGVLCGSFSAIALLSGGTIYMY